MDINYKTIRRNTIIQWVVSLIITAIIIGLFYWNSRNHIWVMHQTELLNMIKVAASQIDGDLHSTLKANRDDEQSDSYKLIKSRLKNIRDAVSDIRFIYTMVKSNDPSKPNQWRFVVDAEENPVDMSHSGDPFDVTDFIQMQSSFDQPIVDEVINQDQWGSFLSAYAPIRNSKGQAVAIVGVDRKGSLILRDLDQLLFNTFIAGTGMILAISLISVFYYRHRQNLLLKQVMEHQYDHIKKLEGLLPICSVCKNIRDDHNTQKGSGHWKLLEDYISDHSSADFTHTICPECLVKHYREEQTQN